MNQLSIEKMKADFLEEEMAKKDDLLKKNMEAISLELDKQLKQNAEFRVNLVLSAIEKYEVDKDCDGLENKEDKNEEV